MLDNWFKPIKTSAEPYAAFQVGAHIRLHQKKGFPALKGVQIALMGIGAETPAAVRSALYQLSFPFVGLQVADLGNFRKHDPDFIIPALRDLIQGGVFPVLIAPEEHYVLTLYHAFHEAVKDISMVIVDERLPLAPRSAELRAVLMESTANRLFHLGQIGYQTHLVDQQTVRQLEATHHDLLRLGKARQDLPEAEPVIRDADLMIMHLGALKDNELPGKPFRSPSGFTAEELCQLSRYGGWSEKLKCAGFFSEAEIPAATGGPLLAQMIWYLLEGFQQRKGDFPASMDGLVEYIVDMKTINDQLVFWKSTKSGRWWLQIPVKAKKKWRRHRLVPCSYQDYQRACQDQLPQRLFHALQRFG